MNPRTAGKRRSQSAHIGRRESNHGQINVGETERQASLIGGSVLALCGLLRGSMSGLALAAIGGGLIYRGITGHCHAYEALGYNSANESDLKHGQTEQPARDDEREKVGSHE